MLNNIIFIVLPYVALALVLIVTPYRFFTNRLGWSAYSTQFLERKTLYWGINPWHYGIILILLAHLVGIVAPGAMKRFLGNTDALIFLESLGLGLAFLALFGSIILLLRRISSPRLQKITLTSDWVLLILLSVQTATGIYISLFMRWGSHWYLHTVVPYFYSLLTFNPQLEYMADFPIVFKLHAGAAFLIIALLPFTKLVHMIYQPITFLKDPSILYRWHSRPK